MSRAEIAHLLDAAATVGRLRDAGVDVVSGRPVHVRYKPGRSALVGYEFLAADGSPGRGYLRWSADAARVDEVAEKWASRRRTSPDGSDSLVRLGADEVFFPFPHDAELVRLRWYTSPRKLKRSIGDTLGAPLGVGRLSGSGSNVRVLVHKPERRAVLRADLVGDTGRRSVVIRCSTEPSGYRRAAIADAAQRAGLATPPSLGVVDDGRVTVDGYLHGTAVAELPECAIRALDPDALADAIHRFHALPEVSAVARMERIERREPADHLRNVTRALSWLAAWDPRRRVLTDAVASRLAATCPAPGRPVLAHGDLHDGNVVVDHDTGDVGLIDLDRVAFSDPELDLGRLRAAALDAPHGEARRGFADAVGAGLDRRHRLDADRTDWYTAVGLVDRAVLAARQLAPDADARGEQLLHEAMHLVAVQVGGSGGGR